MAKKTDRYVMVTNSWQTCVSSNDLQWVAKQIGLHKKLFPDREYQVWDAELNVWVEDVPVCE